MYLVLNEADLKKHLGKDLVQAKILKPDLEPDIGGINRNTTISLKRYKRASNSTSTSHNRE